MTDGASGGGREARRDRRPGSLAVDLVGVAGLVALAAGLAVLRGSPEVGFDAGQAAAGVLSQIGVTLPAAGLVLGVMVLEVAAGLVLARLARRGPFDSLAEAAIAGLTGLVLKDAVVLGLLGGVGLFRAPALVAVDLALLVPAWRGPIARLVRPVVASGRGGWPWRELGSVPLALLVALVWVGPVILQLASPVVPFIDVLPNHVAPAEHLRTFGWLSPLDATFSPIYGPSRAGLGSEGLLGSIATISGLPAALAISAFILPSTLLVGAGVQRLATAVAEPGRPVGPWALLAFAVTESFARLGDARGTVLVLPLVALAFALAAEALRGEPDRWRPSRALAMGVAMGASVLVHPVIGAFTIATVALLALVRPARIAPEALVAGLVAAVVAVPQAAVMVGLAVPPLVLPAAIAIAVAGGAAGAWAVESRPSVAGSIVAMARVVRYAVAAAAVLGLAWASAIGGLRLERLPDGLGYGAALIVEACGVLLLGLVLGWVVDSPAARSAVLGVAVGVGLVAAAVTQLLPVGLGFLGDALRFEVPKTVHYWLPVMVAVAVGPSLAAGIQSTPRPGPRRLPWRASAAAVAAVVVLAAVPLRTAAIDAFHLGEHRWSESLAIDLRWAARGFWVGFPDSRLILDPPRQEIADAVRREIDAGRLRHDTPVLHVAASFQEWVSTPLGVFDGVVETFVSPDQEVSQQTVGGRLHGMADLRGLVDSRAYPYVVLEPNGLSGGSEIADTLRRDGYVPIFENGQGEVFALGS